MNSLARGGIIGRFHAQEWVSALNVYLRYNATNTGNKVASSLQYNHTETRQDVAMMQKQEERHRDEQPTLQRYEFHFTSVQRTSSVTYFVEHCRPEWV